MTEKREKLSPQNVAKICEKVFAMPVLQVSAPGGSSRESLRVHFPARTIVATQRAYAGRMRLEAEVLRRLSAAGAPVPEFLGGTEQIFFQADMGSRRLSGELVQASGQDRLDVAARAIDSLLKIHDAGDKSGLADIAPALGEQKNWVTGFVGTVIKTSERFGIAPPDLDMHNLIERLHVPANRFLKWDARPGNASIGDDDQVYWFDWEHCGKRQGMEDFAWLAGDEFWPVGPDQVVEILTDLLPQSSAANDLDYLGLFITFHIVQRLTIIHRRFTKSGWVDANRAMQYDKIGTDPALAMRLCEHGAGWADRSALSRPMVRWFQTCAKAVKAMQTGEAAPHPNRET